MTFGEPLCTSHITCPDCTENDVEDFVQTGKWAELHQRRQKIHQEESPDNCHGKTKHKFIYRPMISDLYHEVVTEKPKSADAWARRQMGLCPKFQEAAFHSVSTLALDQMWGQCARGEEAKPWSKKKTKNGTAKDAIHYNRSEFDIMIAEYMNIKQIELGDFIIINKSNKDDHQTAPMMFMSAVKYAEYRTGNISLLQCDLRQIPPNEFLGPVLGHETIPGTPHQYLGLTTVMIHPHQPPIVVISTHSFMPLHLSHTKDYNGILCTKWIQGMLDVEAKTPDSLTHWDKQALMTMIDIRDDKDRKALDIVAAKLRPDPEEELPEPETFDDLTKQPATWVSYFGPWATVLRHPFTTIADVGLAMLSTTDSISAVRPLIPEAPKPAMVPQWGAAQQNPWGEGPFPGPPPTVEPTLKPDEESEDEVVLISERKNPPDPPELKDEEIDPTVKFQTFYNKHNLRNGYGIKAVEQQLALEAFLGEFGQQKLELYHAWRLSIGRAPLQLKARYHKKTTIEVFKQKFMKEDKKTKQIQMQEAQLPS